MTLEKFGWSLVRVSLCVLSSLIALMAGISMIGMIVASFMVALNLEYVLGAVASGIMATLFTGLTCLLWEGK